MYFLIEDELLLQEYHAILDKVDADIKKEFGSKPVYNKKFLKTKTEYHGDEVTDFHDKEIPKVNFNHITLAVICLDSALKKADSYYPEVFLKSANALRKN